MEKLTKLGITSLSVMALGAVAPLVAPDVFGANVVYAENIPEGSVKYVISYYDDTMNGTVPAFNQIAPSKEGYVAPNQTVVETPPEIEGYTFTKVLPWGGEQRTSISITTETEDAGDGVIKELFFYTKNPETPAEQPTTPVKPETSTNKPTTGTVIHIGDQPTSPVNDTSLYYTIETQFGDPKDGGWSVEQSPNINVGEIHELEGLSEKSQSWTTYRIMEGTPESYTITYDDVKAGKTHFVFRLYNTKTHNPDGTPKPEVPAAKPETPAEQPSDKPVEKPTEEPQDQTRKLYIGYAIYGDVKRPEGLTSETGTVETTATLNPGESYTFPNVTAPGYKLLGIYDETDKNIGVGGTVNYEDIKYHENLEAYVKQVFYIYEPSTTPNPQPETPAEQPQTPPEVPATKPVEQPTKPAEEQATRTIYVGAAAYDTDGTPLPEVDFGLDGEVAVTPEKPYTVNQPKIDGWEAIGAWHAKEGEYSATKVNNGTQITYDDLPETEEGVYSGNINYYYKRTTPENPTQPETPTEQPQTPPEVPAAKPETPAEKPSDKPVQPTKPAEQPTTPVKPMDKPTTKPTDTNKPVVKAAANGKTEVKPENKVEPKAEVKPTQQSGNAAANAQTSAPKADTKAPAAATPKADKAAEKKMETLPNTGESQSSLALLGLALGILGLQGLTYKGRHDRKR